MGTRFLLTPRPLANFEVYIAHIPPGGATAEAKGSLVRLVLRVALLAVVGVLVYEVLGALRLAETRTRAGAGSLRSASVVVTSI